MRTLNRVFRGRRQFQDKTLPQKIRALFQKGEQGAWYDPSDMSTLFQDAAGTTPVTGMEQPVGRMLDKSGCGNHASQATSASRPVLSARVNMLTKTEDFSDAPTWIKSISGTATYQGTGLQAVVTPNYGIAPNGKQTADRVQLNLNGGTSTNDRSGFYGSPGNLPVGAKTKSVIYLKPLDGTAAEQLLLSNIGAPSFGSTVFSQQVDMLPDGWMMITRINTIGVSSGEWRVQIVGGGGRPNSMDLLVWGGDFRFENESLGLPAYQRVNTSTDYDTAGFPLYLRCDGIDDGMRTNSIDFTATDKMTVVAGVRKLGNTASGALLEFSETWSGYQGSFAIFAPGGIILDGVGFRSNGSLPASVDAITSASPITMILSQISCISAGNLIGRLNGEQVASNLSNQGSGSYGNYPLYLFRRGGVSSPLNGRFYGAIIRGAQSNDTQIAFAERYMNTKTKGY